MIVRLTEPQFELMQNLNLWEKKSQTIIAETALGP